MRVNFDYAEEQEAFAYAVIALGHRIKEDIEKGGNRDSEIRDFHFHTTLQLEVVKDNLDIFMKILGLSVLNILGVNRKDNMVIVPKSPKKPE